MRKIIFLLFSFLSVQITNAQINPQWATKYSANGDYSAKYTCITKDKSDNIYAAGYTVNISNNRDYLVVKMNPNGDTLWTRTFNGSDNSDDEITAIAIDKNENVCATGFANGNGTGNDILTVKLNSNGDTLWTRVYNYTNEDDEGNSIAVDTAGNIFVTGQSDSDPSSNNNDDYITIKYNASGTQQWATRYGSTSTDRAVKIVTDLIGNCYITGRSNNGIDDNFVTIKYDSNGVQKFLKVYDGGGTDRAVAMAIDPSYAAIYVTGRSNNGNDDDIVTLKYNTSAGTLMWTKVYNNVDDDKPVAIVVDAGGFVYVTGQTDVDATTNRNWNFVTIKYSNTSVQQAGWPKTFNGATNNDDIPTAIAVAQNGDVYISGETDTDPSAATINFDFATVKYNSAGVLQWLRTIAGTQTTTDAPFGIVLDNSSQPIVAGGIQNLVTFKDAIAVKYDVTGTVIWNKSFLGTGDNSDNAYAITLDASDNVYIAGYSIDRETDRNMTTVKLNSLGDTQWVRKYNGTSYISFDAANAIAVDASGFVYTVGYTKNSGTSNDFTVLKYNSVGDSVWIKKYNNPLVNGSDKANSVALDASGNVYVTGYSETDNSSIISDDYFTVRYNSVGTQLWVARYNGSGNGEDRATQILLGTTGVYVCGKSWNGNYFDYTLVKYDFNGVQQWMSNNSIFFGDNVPAKMVIDNNENIYITGKGTTIGNTEYDYFLVKYNSSGIKQWSNVYNGIANGNDEATAIALDNSGNCFITGLSDADANPSIINYDYLTIAFNANGDTLWTKTYNGSANGNDIATAIVTDGTGNIYVTGESDNGSVGSPNLNIVTLNYNTAGSLLLYANYNGTGNRTDSPNAIAVRNGNVYVCGESYGSAASQKDLIVIKYMDFNVGLNEINAKNNSLISVYPNPAKDFFNVDFSKIADSKKNTFFVLYNELGLEVKRVDVKNSSSQLIERENIYSGIYFFKVIQDGAIIGVGKISFQ